MKALIFDTETTGTRDPRLVEAAWAELGPLPHHIVMDSFYRRYNPGVPIEYGAMATHHITDEDVADCPPANEFRLPGDVAYLIGHHIDFDYRVARACGPQPEPKRICTLALSRALWPDTDSHGLAAICYLLDRRRAREFCLDAHGAATDVELVRVILGGIMLRVVPQSWEELWEASERARIPTHLTFGKHKGTAIRDVPRDYCDWLVRQSDLDPYLVQALTARICGQ